MIILFKSKDIPLYFDFNLGIAGVGTLSLAGALVTLLFNGALEDDIESISAFPTLLVDDTAYRVGLRDHLSGNEMQSLRVKHLEKRHTFVEIAIHHFSILMVKEDASFA